MSKNGEPTHFCDDAFPRARRGYTLERLRRKDLKISIYRDWPFPVEFKGFSISKEANLLVAMRLTRIGSKKRPYYRIVVIDKRRARNGRFLEVLGQYNPIATPVQLEINAERAQYWLSQGATPSETVRSLLRKKEIVK